MEIYDIIAKTKVRSIDSGMPFQLLLKTSPLNFKVEFDMIAESFVGYSYKNFFECSIVIDKGPKILDHHMKSIEDLELKRKRKMFKTALKQDAIVASCHYQDANQNVLLASTRMEPDSIFLFHLGLMQ